MSPRWRYRGRGLQSAAHSSSKLNFDACCDKSTLHSAALSPSYTIPRAFIHLRKYAFLRSALGYSR